MGAQWVNGSTVLISTERRSHRSNFLSGFPGEYSIHLLALVLCINNYIFLCWCTGFPSSPSEYASLAAQTVIGQVLEGVAPLSDDARVQALSITMTAFMEAWMEHILKQKIKFRYVFGGGIMH